ncbi:hypothetical protein FRC03_005454 [Tulasnella sp. 419]|nr:hypothetical protein FRC03_005454 [Tulasnella sp. 419]
MTLGCVSTDIYTAIRRLVTILSSRYGSSVQTVSRGFPNRIVVTASPTSLTYISQGWLGLLALWPINWKPNFLLFWSGVTKRLGSSLALLSQSPSAAGAMPPDGPTNDHEPPNEKERPPTIIQMLMNHPALFDPVRKPRNPIVLCHGLYGFDVWGPSTFPKLQRHYWHDVLEVLRGKVGAEVLVAGVPGTGSIADRAKKMDGFLKEKLKGRELNLIGHSMGGLDCRYLLSRIRSTEYSPLSLTTIATPHRGSPFMDWCNANIGIGALREAMASSRTSSEVNVAAITKATSLSTPVTTPESSSQSSSSTSQSSLSPILAQLSSLPQSLTTLLLSLVDSPAYSNLTTSYLRDYFNPNTPDVPGVRYFSVSGKTDSGINVFHPLWLPKMILDKTEADERAALISKSQSNGTSSTLGSFMAEEREWGNDGLVTISSAKWGEYLGTIDKCDHWDIRGASGFALAWQDAGEAGGLGWSKGLDYWSKWGIGWFGASESASSTSTKDIAETKQNLDNMKKEEKDAALLSSTMSWIGEHVSKVNVGGSETSEATKREDDQFDLHRFYMALARKLYEEGL